MMEAEALDRLYSEMGLDERPIHPLARYIELTDGIPAIPEMVIDDVLAAGMATFSGVRGGGKTSLLVPMALVPTGLIEGHAMRATIQRRVIYISEDIQQVQRIIAALQADGRLTTDAALLNDWFRLVESKRLAPNVIASVAGHYNQLHTPNQREDGSEFLAAPLVVIDTAASVIDSDNLSDNSEVSRAIATLRQGMGNIPLLIVGHVAKAERTKSNDVTMVGAGAWENDVQQCLYVVRDGDSRYLTLGKRRFETLHTEYALETFRTTLDAIDALGKPSQMAVMYSIPAALEDGHRERAKRQALDEAKAATWQAVLNRVVEYVEAHPGESKRSISERVSGKAAQIRSAIDELSEGGELRREPAPRGGHLYYPPQKDTVGHTCDDA